MQGVSDAPDARSTGRACRALQWLRPTALACIDCRYHLHLTAMDDRNHSIAPSVISLFPRRKADVRCVRENQHHLTDTPRSSTRSGLHRQLDHRPQCHGATPPPTSSWREAVLSGARVQFPDTASADVRGMPILLTAYPSIVVFECPSPIFRFACEQHASAELRHRRPPTATGLTTHHSLGPVLPQRTLERCRLPASAVTCLSDS
jgi:hypothetical protein